MSVDVRVCQLVLEQGELCAGEVFFVAAREFADGVDAVALAGPAAVLLPDETAARACEVTLGELDDIDA